MPELAKCVGSAKPRQAAFNRKESPQMRKPPSFVLLLFAFLFVQTSFAQVILSEGAKESLGKGRTQDITYSLDGARLAVANSTGLWLYDVHTAEVVQLKGHTGVVNSVAFSLGWHHLSQWKSGQNDSIVGCGNRTTPSHLERAYESG